MIVSINKVSALALLVHLLFSNLVNAQREYSLDSIDYSVPLYLELSADEIAIPNVQYRFDSVYGYKGMVLNFLVKDFNTNQVLRTPYAFEDTVDIFIQHRLVDMYKFPGDSVIALLFVKNYLVNPAVSSSYFHTELVLHKFDLNFQPISGEIVLDSSRKNNRYIIEYKNSFTLGGNWYIECPFIVAENTVYKGYTCPHYIILNSNYQTIANDSVRKAKGWPIQNMPPSFDVDIKYSEQFPFVTGRWDVLTDSLSRDDALLICNPSMSSVDSLSARMPDALIDTFNQSYNATSAQLLKVNRYITSCGVGDSLIVFQSSMLLYGIRKPYLITWFQNLNTGTLTWNITDVIFGFNYMGSSYRSMVYNPIDSLVYTVSFLSRYGTNLMQAGQCFWDIGWTESNCLLMSAYDLDANLVGNYPFFEANCCHQDFGIYPSTYHKGAFLKTAKISTDSVGVLQFDYHTFYFDGRTFPLEKENIQKEKTRITLYPNPATNSLTLQENEKLGQPQRIAIHGINGQLIRQQEFDWSIDISDLQPGFYVYYMENKAGESFVQIFEKRE